MKDCSSCSNSAKVYCSACQTYYCTNCLVLKHLSDSFKTHAANYLCEECEEEIAEKSCDTCDQTLCHDCDSSIHNKGKRAQHTRRSVPEPMVLKEVCNLVFLTITFCTKTLNIDTISSDDLQAKIVDLITEINQKTDNKNKISLIIVETCEPDQKRSDLLQSIELENVVIIEESFQDLPWNHGKLEGINEDIGLFFDFKKSSSNTVCSVGFLEGIDSIFVYDAAPNESIGKFITDTSNSKSAKVFYNFESNGEKVLENLSFDQILAFTSDSKSSKDLNVCFEVSDESSCEESFANNRLKTSIEGFSRQDASFSYTEKSNAQKLSNNELWDSKENIDPNPIILSSFFNISAGDVMKGVSTASPLNVSFGPKRSSSSEQPLREVEIQGSTSVGDILQQELMRFAEKGDLLVCKEILLDRVVEVFQLGSLEQANSLLREAETKKLVHTTIRKFLYDQPYFYIGLLLDTLTLESLAWVIRSIKNDLMTPTEKLVLSRIKECYGLKVEQNQWKAILNYIVAHQEQTSKARPSKGYSLYMKKILDPVTNIETNALYLLNEEWTAEDLGTVVEESDEWKAFIVFMDNFFKEEPSKQKHQFREDHAGNSKWYNSVESVLNRPVPHEHEKGLRVAEDIKAIPGGRYGCAQFIKYCGPENLKELSVGRLTLLVQEAINKGIIRYQRTLLVKNTVGDEAENLPGRSEFESQVIHSINNERRAKLTSMVKEALLQILMEKENAEGVSLAQIPFYLKRKLKFTVDFQELGYAKLKNFLSTLKNLVVINSIGTNHTYVKLKGPVPAQILHESPLQRTMHCNKGNRGIANTPQGLKRNQSTPFTPANNMENPNTGKAVNNNLLTIIEGIDHIMKQTPQGLPLQDLEMNLYETLKVKISFQSFGCHSFYDFLIQYADQIVDIEARKDCFFIYPKACTFWARGKPVCPQQTERPAFMNPLQKYETPDRLLKSGWSASGETTLYSNPGSFISKQSPNCSGLQNPNNMAHHHMNKNSTPFNLPVNCSTPSTTYSSHHGYGHTPENFLNGSTVMAMSPGLCSGSLTKPVFQKRAGLEQSNVNVSDWTAKFALNNRARQENANQFGVKQQFRKLNQFSKGGQVMQEPDPENVRFIEGILQDSRENKNQFSYYANMTSNMSSERLENSGQQSFRKNMFSKYVN